jgi:signal peptidase I
VSAPTLTAFDADPVRRAARAVLAAAARGRRERGGPWAEAVLAEFDQTAGRWEAVRWAAGGLRAVWQERRARVRLLPRYARIRRRALPAAAAAMLAAVLVQQYALTSRFEPTGSMAPTLPILSRFLEDKLTFRLTGVGHGDVVVYEEHGYALVKRVVGLPGDTVECRDGRVYLDGAVLDEPYLPAGTRTGDCRAVTVPPGRLYVLGDNRDLSADSRQNGPIRQGVVEGRLLVRYWPLRA